LSALLRRAKTQRLLLRRTFINMEATFANSVKGGRVEHHKLDDTGMVMPPVIVRDNSIFNDSARLRPSRAVSTEGSLALSESIEREKILDALFRQFDIEASSFTRIAGTYIIASMYLEWPLMKAFSI
jgi:hypothetical protein